MGTITPEFSIPSEVYMRRGATDSLVDIIGEQGKRTVIVSTFADFNLFNATIHAIHDSLTNAGMACIIYDDLPNEPNTEDIDTAVSFIKKTNCTTIMGVGGIEALNAAKVIALLVNNYVFCNDLLEDTPTPHLPVHLVTVPCYPLFGFEISPMLYIASIPDNIKKTLFDVRLYPKSVIIDPSLTSAIDRKTIVRHSMAILSVAIESIISKNSSNLINIFALKAIDIIATNVPLLKIGAIDYTLMLDLSTASVLTGIVFAISRLCISGAMGLALTKENDINLADAINVLVPFAMEYNLAAVNEKFGTVARILGGSNRSNSPGETAIICIEAIRGLMKEAECPQSLSTLKVDAQTLKEAAKTTVKYQNRFVENSPQPLKTGDLEAILISALEG